MKKNMTISFTLESVDANRVQYIAPHHADLRYTFTGSGLPFANMQQAFDGTPNKGIASYIGGMSYEVRLVSMPNAYYDNLGSTKIPPCLHLTWNSGGNPQSKIVWIHQEIPYRSLTYPPNGKNKRTVMLYDNDYEFMRSQEEILTRNAYPSYEALATFEGDLHLEDATSLQPNNFWGTRPPV